ncbi:MAG: diguanylate cyclase [Thiohalomonadaceae bacterium]
MLTPAKKMARQGEVFRVAWGPQRFYLSMGWKTLIAFALVVFIPMLGLLALTGSALRDALERETLNGLESNLRGAWRVFHERSNSLRDALLHSAATPSVQEAMARQDRETMVALLNRHAALHPYADVWLVLDPDQRVIARRHGPVGEVQLLNNTVAQALALDKPVISAELLHNDLFIQENPLEHSNLETLVLTQTVVVPARRNGRPVGALVGIVLLNNDNWLPNAIHDYLSIEAALFASVIQESRVISASNQPNNIWATGLLAPMSLNRAIQQGEVFRGQTLINGIPSFVISEPILNLEGVPIGALSIGVRGSSIDALIAENTRYIYLFIGVGMALSLIIAFLAYRDTMTPMRAIIRAMDSFAAGNLDVRTDIRTKDEFEGMGEGFNRMASAVQEHQQRVESFNSLASLLISSRKPKELLRRALDKLIELTGAHVGAIYLATRDDTDVSLTPFVAYGLRTEDMVPLGLGEGLPGEAALQRHPIHVQQPSDEFRVVVNFGVAQALPNEMAFFPIVYRDELLGLLMLGTLNRFRTEEIGTLEYATNQIAIVLENAFTHEKVERLSITDELTQVYNRRYLTQRLNEEFAAAQRYHAPLAVLLLDLDHFKRVNDRLGHPVGDEVLRLTAQVIRRNLREVDVIGRYGGEEFLVLLPHTSHADALAVADKIRAAVESASLPDYPDLRLTTSVGLAAYPDPQVHCASELVKRADEALYAAKSTGRNRVVAAA